MLKLFRQNPVRQAAELAYARIVEQARRPEFFCSGGVPDTVDGRFELICLHAFLYLHRLRGEESGAEPLGRLLCETMFTDFDRSLREMGTGDLSVGREVRRMAAAFYGRVAAYDRGLADGDGVLAPALARNLFGTAPPLPAGLTAMTDYVRREAAGLQAQEAAALLAGEPSFGPPPDGAGR
jgi:cytochrome b pre-mRNA-processing protein 3